MLRICETIKKKELDKLKKYFSFDDIKKAYVKAKGGIGDDLGKVFKGALLRKVYLTSKTSSGRILFIFFVEKDVYIPIILRLKNDKIIGNNISMNNSDFVELLNKNLDILHNDLKNKRFENFK